MLSILPLLLLSVLGTGIIGPSDEEQYVGEIRGLIVAANLHLVEATDALAQCLGNFTGCIADPGLVVRRLGAARDGLVDLRINASRLTVPDRYRAINDLIVQALTDSVDGIALHMEGLQEASLAKFEAGSDLTAQGREELMEAVALLETTPPTSSWTDLLLILLIAIPVALAASVALLLWRYRRQRRERPPLTEVNKEL